jgi:hypothetical protein
VKFWLVEEHRAEAYDTASETVSWHVVVPGMQAVNAFMIAESKHAGRSSYGEGRYRTVEDIIESGDWSFAFGPSELEEVINGYLWQAADGSHIAYEVRYLGDLVYDTDRGTVDFE